MKVRTGRLVIVGLLALALVAVVLAPALAVSAQANGLYTGRKLVQIGYTLTSNDSTNLYVTMVTQGNWMISESHVHAATTLEGIPQSNGNPVPGQFAYKMTHTPWVNTITYTIPLADIGATTGDTVCVATHAVIKTVCGCEETAWGNCNDFPGKNWAKYIRYTIQASE